MTASWRFAANVPRERQDRLNAVTSFDEVVSRLKAGTIEKFEEEERRNPPCLGCTRAVFRIRVRECDYDAFLNSPVGYRAQFCIDIEYGRQQNRKLIDALTPLCASYISITDPQIVDFVSKSLGGTDAKVWVNDDDWQETNDIQIDYQPWVAKRRATKTGTTADQAIRGKAELGVLAPTGTHIELKGAWITKDQQEWRDPSKAYRAEDIRHYGYA